MSQSMINGASPKRRTILVIEDNELNREILTAMLEDEYNILTAENGLEGLEQLSSHVQELSLILLDVYMPVCNGFEFLEKVAEDKVLSSVPVIVATGSNRQEDEAKCLRLGAVEFVTKPYNPDVVRSRVHSFIRFRESAAALSVVERDEMTGLYTMQGFNHRVNQIITENQAESYTLIVVDIHSFKLIATVFGREKAVETLKFVGDKVKSNGFTDICARSEDIFYLFIQGPCTIDPAVFDTQYPTTLEDGPVPSIQLKIGIYQDIDTSLTAAILCGRAVLASEKVKASKGEKVCFYDTEMHNRLIESHLIESSFHRAIEEHQFQTFYQPKYRPCADKDQAEIVGAEALVRWIQPDGSIMPPGKFIPLFENNGQIAQLDEMMFREVCWFQKERLLSGKKTVPVSINLSRNSIYQNDALSRYLGIAREAGVPLELVPIEMTESATTEGSTVRRLVSQFTEAGFVMHMDDFGAGYSSLASLTTMPFSVIKLDKTLSDQIGSPKGEIMIEHLIMIAHKFGNRIVAEGVETRKQVDFLQSVDCDVIQGYYFSKPVCQSEFTKMLEAE